jgi:predicted HTH domain antitoxin
VIGGRWPEQAKERGLAMTATTISIEIPIDVLDSARLKPEDVKLELALYLYEQGKLGQGKARELAGLSLWEFRQHLSIRRIPVHYGVDDFNDDLAMMNTGEQ